MNGTRELWLHRILTFSAMVALGASVGWPSALGARAQERTKHECACGAACRCAEPRKPDVMEKRPDSGMSADVMAKLQAARKAANESAAIATLRNLLSAQAQMQAFGAIDCDGDGIGEYGYLGELSGGAPMRARAGRAATIGVERLNPPVLSSKFVNVQNGAVERNGYLFRVFLPDAAKRGVPESDRGGASPKALPNADHSEVLWCAYAWPSERGASGDRAFFVNQEGDILQCGNVSKGYSGAVLAPACDAAFAKGGAAGCIDGPLAPARPGKLGMDGEVWSTFE